LGNITGILINGAKKQKSVESFTRDFPSGSPNKSENKEEIKDESDGFHVSNNVQMVDDSDDDMGDVKVEFIEDEDEDIRQSIDPEYDESTKLTKSDRKFEFRPELYQPSTTEDTQQQRIKELVNKATGRDCIRLTLKDGQELVQHYKVVRVGRGLKNDAKRYPCYLCKALGDQAKSFDKHSNLRNHYRSHLRHGNERTICGGVFRRSTELQSPSKKH
jgi:hypothetical protein